MVDGVEQRSELIPKIGGEGFVDGFLGSHAEDGTASVGMGRKRAFELRDSEGSAGGRSKVLMGGLQDAAKHIEAGFGEDGSEERGMGEAIGEMGDLKVEGLGLVDGWMLMRGGWGRGWSGGIDEGRRVGGLGRRDGKSFFLYGLIEGLMGGEAGGGGFGDASGHAFEASIVLALDSAIGIEFVFEGG